MIYKVSVDLNHYVGDNRSLIESLKDPFVMSETAQKPVITEETVKHVAHLSRLALDDADIQHYTKDLANIIDLVSLLNELDLDDINITVSAKDATPFREDAPVKRFERDTLLENAPEPEDGFFRVPKILDN